MKVLVTGGAGFIGSNLADALLKDSEVTLVRVVDNLSTGFRENISQHIDNPKFEFIEGDIADINQCKEAVQGCTHISHQAALGSVPRSIKDPVATNYNNITGTLNVLQSAREQNIKRIVFASSSSVYGDDANLPKVEYKTGNVLSPYALTKKTKEEYAKLFAELFDLSIIGLRYFNVFGPKQSPKGAYAAVIPLFISKLMAGIQSDIHGDGEQSRDFTFIKNVVNANILALKAKRLPSNYNIYNIAFGDKTTVNQLYFTIANLLGKDIQPRYTPSRTGDIKHSLADITKIKKEIEYQPLVSIKEGLVETVNWFKDKNEK